MSEDVIIPVRSKGYVSQPTDQAHVFWTDYDTEHVPELYWPTSITTYERMRKDPQVAAILRAVLLPILRTPKRIDPAGASDAAVRLVADDLNLPVIGEGQRPSIRTRGRFSLSEHLRLALSTMLPLGAAFFEQEAEVVDGRAHLRRLGFRPLRTLAEPPKVARDGGLVSIKQVGIAGESSREIPVRQLVAYVHEREGGSWLGTSILRPAYGPWLLKDRLLRIDTISKDRYGVGTPVYTSGRDDGQDIDKGSELMQSMRSGDQSGFAQPKGARSEILTPLGSAPDTLRSIEYHDRKIAGTVLGHWMNLGQQSGTGSYALGAVQVEEFNQSLETISRFAEDIVNSHIVEDLIDWNWGPLAAAPRVVFDEIGSREQWTAIGLKYLVDAGILRPDRSLEEWLRQSVGAPPKDQPQEVAT